MTDQETAVLMIAYHFAKYYQPLREGDMPHAAVEALLARGYLERYQNNDSAYRITNAGRYELWKMQEEQYR